MCHRKCYQKTCCRGAKHVLSASSLPHPGKFRQCAWIFGCVINCFLVFIVKNPLCIFLLVCELFTAVTTNEYFSVVSLLFSLETKQNTIIKTLYYSINILIPSVYSYPAHSNWIQITPLYFIDTTVMHWHSLQKIYSESMITLLSNGVYPGISHKYYSFLFFWALSFCI